MIDSTSTSGGPTTTSVRVAVRIRPPPCPAPLGSPPTLASVTSPSRSSLDASSPPTTPSTPVTFWGSDAQGPAPATVVTATSPASLHVLKASTPQPGIAAATALAAEGNWEFDAVYGGDVNQSTIFYSEVSPLISWFLEGFNVTLLAYGQTGSGKTYSMGTDITSSAVRRASNFSLPTSPIRTASATSLKVEDVDEAATVEDKPPIVPIAASQLTAEPTDDETTQSSHPASMGIIPRALEAIFASVAKDHADADANVRHELRVSFLELYNEEWVDLLKQGGNAAGASGPPGGVMRGAWASSIMSLLDSGSQITIREDKDGKLTVHGASEIAVANFEEAMKYLMAGSRARTTASTAMNDRSSRSHAIFTLTLKTTRPRRSRSPQRKSSAAAPSAKPTTPKPTSDGWMVVTSKFHFVDLAGSERLKRTKNTGDRKAEGIAINQGLLVLGRVIHALSEVGEGSERAGSAGAVGANGQYVGAVKVVPYRDSKLTRFLQDSLGGNSRTVMLACISPTEADLPETISTLRYASRARGIRNRAKVNLVLEQQQQKEKDAIVAAAAATEAKLLGEVAELRAALKEVEERARTAEEEAMRLRGELGEVVRAKEEAERVAKEKIAGVDVAVGTEEAVLSSSSSSSTLLQPPSRDASAAEAPGSLKGAEKLLTLDDVALLSPASDATATDSQPGTAEDIPPSVTAADSLPPLPPKSPFDYLEYLGFSNGAATAEDVDDDEDLALLTRYARLRDRVKELKGLVGSALAVGSGARRVEEACSATAAI
ncbi:hypothetical protein HDU96_007941 [Phlyctochytrium bullatum]|nr:hypothetical protein HDU96_007941 [Phlyctochytrium bullatum]